MACLREKEIVKKNKNTRTHQGNKYIKNKQTKKKDKLT